MDRVVSVLSEPLLECGDNNSQRTNKYLVCQVFINDNIRKQNKEMDAEHDVMGEGKDALGVTRQRKPSKVTGGKVSRGNVGSCRNFEIRCYSQEHVKACDIVLDELS